MVLLKKKNQAAGTIAFYYNAEQYLNRKERKHQVALMHPVQLGKCSTCILGPHVAWDHKDPADTGKQMAFSPDYIHRRMFILFLITQVTCISHQQEGRDSWGYVVFLQSKQRK